MARSKSFPPPQRPFFHTDPSGGEVLVYLDIDGVLNTTAHRKAREHLGNDLIASLKRVLDAVPEAGIVLSSSWRLQPALIEALEARLTAEGVSAPVGVTGEIPLPERDPNSRGEADFIETELKRLAAQRSAEINVSVMTRRPLAWIALDDLDLSRKEELPESMATASQGSQGKMGYPTRRPHQVDARGRSSDRNGRSKVSCGLPPLASRQPFSQGERRVLSQHPLAARLPRRRPSKGPRPPEASIGPMHFVHTSEAAGLTSERAEFAIGLLKAQLSNAEMLA